LAASGEAGGAGADFLTGGFARGDEEGEEKEEEEEEEEGEEEEEDHGARQAATTTHVRSRALKGQAIGSPCASRSAQSRSLRSPLLEGVFG